MLPGIVMVDVRHPMPKQPSNVWPIGDVDNYMKSPLDAITKAEIWWQDDVQIVGAFAIKRFVELEDDVGVACSYIVINPEDLE